MAPLRSLLVLLIFAGLICAATAVAQAPVEWYSGAGGGGAAAGPQPPAGDGGGARSSAGGGTVAPTYATPIPTAPPQVNLPPPTEMPASDSPPAQAAGAHGVIARAAGAHAAGHAGERRTSGHAAAGTAAAGSDAAAGGTLSLDDGLHLDAQPAANDWGPIPFKGWELAALALAGVCLLIGGAALRPRPARR